jgi:hypothetical protein
MLWHPTLNLCPLFGTFALSPGAARSGEVTAEEGVRVPRAVQRGKLVRSGCRSEPGGAGAGASSRRTENGLKNGVKNIIG